MGEDSKNIVITSAVRTPIGTFRGSLKDLEAKDLGALVTKESLKRSNLNPNDVDDVFNYSNCTLGSLELIPYNVSDGPGETNYKIKLTPNSSSTTLSISVVPSVPSVILHVT